ncbi:MAG: zf-HC2 domain-containing protein [Sphaerochaetaceae bacterium]|nr:zf-HC2 domain-containing protein [Sphaerochaetaceae bacterium]
MCLDDQILNTYLDDELVEPWKTQVIEHLKYCSACSTRYEQLKAVHTMVSTSRLKDEQVDASKDKIYAYLENRYLKKEKKIKFLHRDFRVKTSAVIGVAAAFVLMFVGALTLNSPTLNEENVIIPQVVDSQGQGAMQVRATENLAASQVLSNLSLEEILSYLDQKGYEVDLKLKSVTVLGDDTGK